VRHTGYAVPAVNLRLSVASCLFLRKGAAAEKDIDQPWLISAGVANLALICRLPSFLTAAMAANCC